MRYDYEYCCCCVAAVLLLRLLLRWIEQYLRILQYFG
jgi:hypothetical protein